MPSAKREALLSRCTDFGEMRLASMDQAGIVRAVLALAGPGVQAEHDVSAAIRSTRELRRARDTNFVCHGVMMLSTSFPILAARNGDDWFRKIESSIGDALTMIPPFTGNGMSMAFESAELAVESLERWSSGKSTWTEARQSIASQCDEAFALRLSWANRLHALMFLGPLQPAIVRWLPSSKWSWKFLFSHTR